LSKPPVSRLIALFVGTVLLLCGIVVRLAVLQVRDQSQYETLGMVQRERTIDLPADRGLILDRNGVPLALTMEARDIYVNPTYVTDATGEAAELGPLLGVKPKTLLPALTHSGTFAYVARQVDVGVAQNVAALQLPGIDELPVPKRYYPSGALAPQVLGFVGIDGNGLAGIEKQYDTALRGTPGQRTQEYSPGGVPISTGVDTVSQPIPGENLVTTLDRQMQFQVQTALANAVHANAAKGGTVVVMDPSTGDVYAMATYPSFDPKNFATTDPQLWRNRPLTDTFEPGSVSKIITAAAALETGAVSPTQTFHVPYSMRLDPRFTIYDSHPHPVESMTLGDIIAESSNIGAAMVAEREGSDALATYMDRFGYGDVTGTGFPGEAAGSVPKTYDDVIRATAAYGQGVAVTPMQMADVYATIANGGVWVQPRLVRGSQGPAGGFHAAPASPRHRVIRADTAQMLTRMLAEVVQDGTGAEAEIPGYQVAGKTGTAHKIDAYGHYINKYMASFVGFLPAGDPKVVIAVSIDEPGTIYGGLAAAPLFSEIARYAIQRLGIPSVAPVTLPPSDRALK
jgi:cell division protein FtsI (penicillin-binding protein 3)